MHHNFVWLFCFTFNFTGCVCLCMLEFVLELSCFLFVIYLPVAFITAATFFKAKKSELSFLHTNPLTIPSNLSNYAIRNMTYLLPGFCHNP